jgi:ribonuclease HI
LKKKSYYAVAVGRKSGIYTEWFGDDGAQIQVIRFPGAVYKGFPTRSEAEAFIARNANRERPRVARPVKAGPTSKVAALPIEDGADDGRIIVYTDGGCMNNPGPGGYGVVLRQGTVTKELSGGYRLTTNNRMEMMACIVALCLPEKPSSILLFSDSRYVVDSITKGWAKKWRANNWIKSDKKSALNADLWERLLELCKNHVVEFRWVKGHAGNAYNERCDQLATQGARQPDLPADVAYEATCASKKSARANPEDDSKVCRGLVWNDGDRKAQWRNEDGMG